MVRRLFVLALVAACVDPVHDEEVAALGPEASGVEEGPLHRPGQACTTCHGGKGPGEPDFSVAGTVYLRPDSNEPAVGAKVTIIDASGKERELETNEAGNFYVEKDAYDPPFPLRVRVQYGADAAQEMKTLIRRDAGCGRCHEAAGVGDREHAKRIYVTEGGP